jgi:hypothetical protein
VAGVVLEDRGIAAERRAEAARGEGGALDQKRVLLRRTRNVGSIRSEVSACWAARALIELTTYASSLRRAPVSLPSVAFAFAQSRRSESSAAGEMRPVSLETRSAASTEVERRAWAIAWRSRCAASRSAFS